MEEGAGGDAVVESDQLTLHAPVSPTRLLGRRAHHEVRDRRCARGRPGLRRGVTSRPSCSRPGLYQRSLDRSIWPAGSWSVDVVAQHRDVVAQDADLEVFDGGAADGQPQPAEHGDRDQVQQSEQHGR